MDQLPKMRTDIHLAPAIVHGRQVLAVQDMTGIMDEGIALLPEIAGILHLFDGNHTLRDLQMALMHQRGNRLVMRDEAEQIIQELDRLLILQTDRYSEKKQAKRKEFLTLPYRAASHAGTAYPENPDELRQMLDDMLGTAESNKFNDQRRIRALVTPHIDIAAGRSTYAKAYAELRGMAPSRIIVLGTGHALDDGLFSLTTKKHITPLGDFPVDADAVRALQTAGGCLVSADDFAHRSEHSIEFQMVFLRYLFDGDVPVVPILCGSFHQLLNTVNRPAEIAEAGPFIEELSRIADDDALVVAGVDLSHVGPKFGHQYPAAYYQNEFQSHDRRLLDALCAGSVNAFWDEAKRVEDRYHVCGFSALASLLEALTEIKGTVLDYQVWHDSSTSSAVSFAAAALG